MDEVRARLDALTSGTFEVSRKQRESRWMAMSDELVVFAAYDDASSQPDSVVDRPADALCAILDAALILRALRVRRARQLARRLAIVFGDAREPSIALVVHVARSSLCRRGLGERHRRAEQRRKQHYKT